MTFRTTFERLEQMPHVQDVKNGSTGHISAIDFRLFPLHRPTDTCNFVFRIEGFQGGLLRLPRVPKAEYTETDVQQRIENCLPGFLAAYATVRLEPEVDLNDDYHYPHVELPGSSLTDALETTRLISENYTPLN